MIKKSPIYFKFFILSLLLLTSCVSGCVTFNNKESVAEEILPRHSFVQIQHSVEVEGCGLDSSTGKEKCQKAVMQYVSSGAYVFHSEVSQGTSYVLTAGHSCESKFPKSQIIEGFRVQNKGSKFKTVDLNGFQNEAEVILINKRFDLCLLRVSNVLTNPPTLKLADKEPKRGETVSNMAAPHGLFWSGTVLIFKGQFSGYHTKGYSVYTIPTKPGSSGSPILNKDNKLVGVIFAGYRTIENVGLSSPLVAIRVFLKKAIAKGEMELWENNNQPKLNTQIDRLWIQEMQHKLTKVFGK
jgi:S1-C subfamily serine protease